MIVWLAATNCGVAQSVAADVALSGIKLTASDRRSNDWFGSAVAIDSGIAVAGAQFDEDGVCCSFGSAYVFEREGSNWIQRAKLKASDGSPSAFFGSTVAVSFKGLWSGLTARITGGCRVRVRARGNGLGRAGQADRRGAPTG